VSANDVVVSTAGEIDVAVDVAIVNISANDVVVSGGARVEASTASLTASANDVSIQVIRNINISVDVATSSASANDSNVSGEASRVVSTASTTATGGEVEVFRGATISVITATAIATNTDVVVEVTRLNASEVEITQENIDVALATESQGTGVSAETLALEI